MKTIKRYIERLTKSAAKNTAQSVALIAVVMMSALTLPATAQTLDKGAIGEIVRDYLLENPEVVRDALIELDRREKEAEAVALQQMVEDPQSPLFSSEFQVVLGNPDGDVTLVEFFDYNCGYCKRAYSDLARLLDEDENLRVVLKEFPVLGQPSAEAARVAVAVNKVAPEKYAEFHEKLLLGRGQANHASSMEAAIDVGVSKSDLEVVIGSDLVDKTVGEVYALAKSLGMTGTPSYVVGNEVVPGAIGYAALKSKIDALRACGETSCS
ncbi:MAG: DsbA family protein [Rhodobacteraceae bacterium]|nr:DsbA family protein [Paracoccaceae bacterium]